MTGLSRPETATQVRTSHRKQRLTKRRCRPLPTKPDLQRARPPTRAFFLGEDIPAAADIAQVQSVAGTMSDSPAAGGTPSARKNQTQRKTPRTGTTNNAKGTTR